MMSRTFLMGLLVATALGAYPLLASLMTLAGAGDTRLPSILIRLMVGVLAIWVMIANRHSFRIYRPELLAAAALFWALYLFRIIDEGFLAQVVSPFDPVELLALAVLFVLLPTLPMFIGLNPMSSASGYKMFTLLGALTVTVLLLESGDIALQMMDTNALRFSVEKLNPISVGYVGGTFMLMCAVGLFRPWKRPGMMATAFYGAGMVAGLFTLVIAASRGPALATVASLLAYAIIPPRFNRLAITAALGLAGIALIYMMRGFMLSQFEIDVFARFIDAGSAYDMSAISREESFAGAWQQFMNNPFFGDSLVEKTTGSYTHNSILEALMATGVFGFLAYMACVVMAVIASIKLLYREDGYEWLALLALFYLLGSQFSGAHYGNGALWMTMIAVTVTEIKLRGVSQANRHRRARQRSEHQAGLEERDARPRNFVEGELMKQSRDDHKQT